MGSVVLELTAPQRLSFSAAQIVGQDFCRWRQSAARVDGDHDQSTLSYSSNLRRARSRAFSVHRGERLRRMRNEARRHRDAVERPAVEERDLVVVDVAVVPGCALVPGAPSAGLGRKFIT